MVSESGRYLGRLYADKYLYDEAVDSYTKFLEAGKETSGDGFLKRS